MECSICQEKIYKWLCQNKKLSCGHDYHRKCINKWLTKESNCPVCRNVETSHHPYTLKDGLSRSHNGVPIMPDRIFAATRVRFSFREVIDNILIYTASIPFFNSLEYSSDITLDDLWLRPTSFICKLIFYIFSRSGILLNRIMDSKVRLSNI